MPNLSTTLLLSFLFLFSLFAIAQGAEPTVSFDAFLFPTITNDLDPRTYYQGAITILGCSQRCVSATWSLSIDGSLKDSAQTMSNYIDNTKGSLTSWSFYLNSESLCTNTAPSSSPTTIQTCASQEIDDKSEFSGQFRWKAGQKAERPLDKVTFRLKVEIQYDHDDDRETDTETLVLDVALDRTMRYVDNAGNVEYIGATKKANFQYSYTSSFRLNSKVNHFALRPYGALSHVQFKKLSCTVNGIALSQPVVYHIDNNKLEGEQAMQQQRQQGQNGHNTAQFHQQGDPTDTPHPLFATYLFTLLPHAKPIWVPYSHYKRHSDDHPVVHDELIENITTQQQNPSILSPSSTTSYSTLETDAADIETFSFEPHTFLSMECFFEHSSRFFADELPFGMAMSFGYFDSEIPFDVTNAQDVTRIKELLTTAPMWFIPRFNVYNQLEATKEHHIVGVYYSGLSQRSSGNNYYGDMIIDLDILPNLSYRCQNPTGQAQLGIAALLVTVLTNKVWDVKSARFLAVGYDQETKTPIPFTLSGILTDSDSLHEDGLLSFESINLCPLIDTYKDLSQTRSVRLSFFISARYTGTTTAYPIETEYPTPGGFSPTPFNVLVTLQQSSIDTEKRVLTSYFPHAISWSTSYQLLVSQKRQYPGVSLSLNRKDDSDRNYSFSIQIQSLKEAASMFLFLFPAGNWGFHGEYDTNCELYNDDNGKLYTPVQPVLIDYSSPRSGLAVIHPVEKFEADIRYHLKCQHGYISNSTIYHSSNLNDNQLGFFSIPSTDALNQYIHVDSDSKERDLRIRKALQEHVSAYTPKDLDKAPEYSHGEFSVLTVPHYTAADFSFPKAPKSPVAIIVAVVIVVVVLIAAGIGFFCWRRRQANLRKAAFMAYVDVYENSVQEYM